MVVGRTGSGKSTTCNAVVAGPNAVVNDETTGGLMVMEPLEHNDCEMFKIGSSTKSVTQAIGFYPLNADQSVYIADCAGFDDSNQRHSYANLSELHWLMCNCNSFNLYVIVKGSELDANRGAGILSLAAHLVRLFKSDAIKNGKVTISTLITAPAFYSGIPAIDRAFKAPIDLLDEKLRALTAKQRTEDHNEVLEHYSSMEYPQDDELQEAKKIVQQMARSYRIVDPNNWTREQFKAKEVTVEQLNSEMTNDTKLAMNWRVVAADMHHSVSNQLHSLLSDGLQGVPEFEDNDEVRQELTLLVERIVTHNWQGPNADGVVRQLRQQCTLAVVKRNNKLLNWFSQVFVPVMTDVFNQSKIPRFDWSNNSKKWTQPFYGLFCVYFLKNGCATETNLTNGLQWPEWLQLLDYMRLNSLAFSLG